MKLNGILGVTVNAAMNRRVKKGIALSSLLFICIPFCAAEITFSPGIGGTVHTVQSFFEIQNAEDPEHSVVSEKAVTYTIPVPSSGLDIHFTHESSGFTLSVINNIGFPITLFKKGGFGNETQRVIGFILDEQVLFGYTYGVKQPFSIHFGIGPGAVLGHFWTLQNVQISENVYYTVTPIALHLGVQYLFTQHVGIAIGIHDMLGVSGIFLSDKSSNSSAEKRKVTGTVGLGNTFTLRIAATLRF